VLTPDPEQVEAGGLGDERVPGQTDGVHVLPAHFRYVCICVYMCVYVYICVLNPNPHLLPLHTLATLLVWQHFFLLKYNQKLLA
jgi:hypothetical protein